MRHGEKKNDMSHICAKMTESTARAMVGKGLGRFGTVAGREVRNEGAD